MGLKATHPGTGIEFVSPPDWQVAVSGPDTVIAIDDVGTERVPRVGVQPYAARQLGARVQVHHDAQPRAMTRFRANLVLTVVDNADVTFARWQRASDEALPLLLNGYELLDVQRLSVAGGPGGRRLARHLDAAGGVLVMQQWFTTVGHLGLTLTATCDIGSYRLLLPQMRAAAASLTLPEALTKC